MFKFQVIYSVGHISHWNAYCVYNEASLIWTPLIRIIHLSGPHLSRLSIYLDTYLGTMILYRESDSVIRTVNLGMRCPDKWGSTVPQATVSTCCLYYILIKLFDEFNHKNTFASRHNFSTYRANFVIQHI